MANTINSPEYAFTYIGSNRLAPGSDAAKLKTLKDDGPMLLAKECEWATMLPDVVDTQSHAPKVSLFYISI